MPKYQRWRRGTVSRIKDKFGVIHGKRVGPVPPKDGSGYRSAPTPTCADMYEAILKIRTSRVIVCIYYRKDSPGHVDEYKWTCESSRETSEVKSLIFSECDTAGPEKFAEDLLESQHPFSKVMAWSFVEVYGQRTYERMKEEARRRSRKKYGIGHID